MIPVYSCFEYLNKFNNIFIYSDPHFNDPEMKYLRKNYISDEQQINRINSVLGRKDVIIFLGDIGDVSFITKIRGYKILVKGNHDTGSENYKRKVVNGQDNKLFDEVYKGIVCLNSKIVLSHEPINLPFMFNIHGHDHAYQLRDNLHLNVCAEHINYTPVNIKTVYKSGILKNINSIHRLTIDQAALNSRNRQNNKEVEK